MKKLVSLLCEGKELPKQEDYPNIVYLQDSNILGYFVKRHVKNKADKNGNKYDVSKTVILDNRDGKTTGVINESTRQDGYRYVCLNLIDGDCIATLQEIAQARDILPSDLKEMETVFYNP